jgi:hypothetical protein
MEFVCREMLARLKKSLQNCVALRRLLQPYTFKVLVQDGLRLADHFA